ncbi:type ISP restriction/modification enzyme [Gramella sp. Hel_I_59]|uniref:type ISP restriction/modification enzyme n=1 Tax=Gramella sp. Hel_I_59 TaxID=1249978 RepID=UPI00115094B0|nr:type ISP restriction/modification enzyme [Gramella sp. Hel_I_59]
MNFFLDPNKISRVKSIIENFYSQTPKGISSPKQLAEVLAIRARFLRDFLNQELERQEVEHTEGRLYGLYKTFKKNIFSELSTKEFSDAFSQTLVYGLFLSKLNADTNVINLYNAKKYILPAFGLISELVDFLDVLEKREYKDSKWIVEEILSVMNTLNLAKIIKNLSYEKFRTSNLFDESNISYKDPYIYFYEHFLAAYDKKLRKTKGVYYTPPQVVNFIVKSLNILIKKDFQIDNGFANKDKVRVLDFATGTGTFLLEILEEAFNDLPKGSGKKDSLIKHHILKNFYGFEYLIAPYTVANLKLSQFLKDQNYLLEDDDRFQIYLTNTLEPVNKQMNIPLLPSLSQESKAAQEVKDKPILVITGNPPYSGVSKNKGKWITDLIETYKYVDGSHFKEKKHWLGDDYVKFIRFAQWKMDQVEEGVVGIITNHRFLSNPTFRGMRQSLMQSFDQIYLLDLHGSNKPKEFAPDGSPDENVFDIEQGVAISFFVKKKGLDKKIFQSDLFGKRADKYDFCLENDIETVEWKEINPTSPFYLFIEDENDYREDYEKGLFLSQIFQKDVNGVQTSRDKFITDLELDPLRKRLQTFKDLNLSETEIKEKFKIKDTRGWKISKARESLNNLENWEEHFKLINYRPFDYRHIFYNSIMIDWPRTEVMKNMLHENIGICVGRAGQNVNASVEWNLAYISENIIDLNLFYRGGEVLYPLYIYSKPNGLFNNQKNSEFIKSENFTPDFRNKLNLKYDNPTGEEIIGYIYSILYSPIYRKKYRSFLDIDFPRIIFVEDKSQFYQLSKIGWDIINAHIFKKVPGYKEYPYGDFKGKGDDIASQRKFVINREDENGRIYI